MRRNAAALLLLLAFGAPGRAQDVRVSVLSRFHPARLELRPAGTQALVLATANQVLVLAPGSSAAVAVDDQGLLVTLHGHSMRASALRASGRVGAAALVLAAPGEFTRRYFGNLTVTARGRELAVVIRMDLETAVASVVQAESAPGTPPAALAAQAIVTRSYFAAARARHDGFDFCDLAHCQVLRDPPAPQTPASRAARETSGLVLAYQDRPFVPMYTRSCGGRTRTPAEAGLPVSGYPFFSVVCPYCYSHPFLWTRSLDREDADLAAAQGEPGRLAVDRRLGWNTIPSNDFSLHVAGDSAVLQGRGQGHGIGLCQRGAAALASSGATYRQILALYFPNTRIISLPHS